MDAITREARNKYMRNYRRNNPERIKKINERYWEKRAKGDIKLRTETVR